MGRERVKQRKVFYMVVSVQRLDGLIDEESIESVHVTEKEAFELAKTLVEEHGDRAIVYECSPLIQVDQRRLRITRLQKGDKS